MLDSVLSLAQVGSPETVKAGVEAFIARHQPDELMVTGQIYDHAARLRSYEILSGRLLTPEREQHPFLHGLCATDAFTRGERADPAADNICRPASRRRRRTIRPGCGWGR